MKQEGRSAVIVLMLVVMLFGQGCCTLFTGDPQTITVNSRSSGGGGVPFTRSLLSVVIALSG